MIALAPEVAAMQEPRAPQSESAIVADLQQTVSASRLNTFLQCRLKFFFRYVAKLPKPKSPALHVGQTVHAVLKVWHKARWRDEPLLPEQLQAAYDRPGATSRRSPYAGRRGRRRSRNNSAGGCWRPTSGSVRPWRASSPKRWRCRWRRTSDGTACPC